MRATMRGLAACLIGVAALAGCGGDVSQMLTSNPETQTKVFETIAEHSDLAGRMSERLLAADSTRAILLDQLLGNAPAVQELMGRMAKDPTMVDGIINVAVQDSSMRQHVVTLLRGMQMVGGAPR